jgi:hypothetical protein
MRSQGDGKGIQLDPPLKIMLDQADGLDGETLCKCDLVFARPKEQLTRQRGTEYVKAVEINKVGKRPQGFCRPARRERGAYPQRSATSEQRSWAAKEQGSLPPLFISTA